MRAGCWSVDSTAADGSCKVWRRMLREGPLKTMLSEADSTIFRV